MPTNGKFKFFCAKSLWVTGKSFSEALILASTNPHYDKRLFIESPVQCMKITSSEHVVYINCSEYPYVLKYCVWPFDIKLIS